MPSHHPDDELLMQYAAGQTPESVALVVATHVGSCPRCQAMTGGLDAVGGACLDELEPVAMNAGALDALLARLDDDGPAEPIPQRIPGVPSPLDTYLPASFDALPWKRRPGGIRIYDLDIDTNRAFLLHIGEGARTPMHTHRGSEYTLVVDGAFSDETGEYRAGDFVVTDSNITHQPAVVSDSDCICLAVLDAPIKLTGPRGWLINPFLR